MAKILLIDDDADFTAATAMLLAGRHYEVVTAASVEEGFEKAAREKPDLMLLDVMMARDDDGFVLARKLKADAALSHIPVILLTGIRKAKGLPFSYEPDEDWLPVAVVLEKPVKPETLFAAIGKALKG